MLWASWAPGKGCCQLASRHKVLWLTLALPQALWFPAPSPWQRHTSQTLCSGASCCGPTGQRKLGNKMFIPSLDFFSLHAPMGRTITLHLAWDSASCKAFPGHRFIGASQLNRFSSFCSTRGNWGFCKDVRLPSRVVCLEVSPSDSRPFTENLGKVSKKRWGQVWWLTFVI